MRRLCAVALFWMVCLALGSFAVAEEDIAYSAPFVLQGLLEERVLPMAEAASEAEIMTQAMAEGSAVQAHLMSRALEFAVEPEWAMSYYDTLLSGTVTVRAEADGRCFLEVPPDAGAIVLNRDSIAPPYQTTVLCSLQDLSMWGWREDYVPERTSLGDDTAVLVPGEIDPSTGELIGYRATPGRLNTVFIVYADVSMQYELRYYDAEGMPIEHGPRYALNGSDLRWPPEGVALPVPEGLTMEGFVLLGTETPAPEGAMGPLKLQIKLAEAYTVTFMNGDTRHDMQWVPANGRINWDRVPDPVPPPGKAFRGWAIEGWGDVLMDRGMEIFFPLTLCAQFMDAHTVTFYARQGDAAAFRSVGVVDGRAPDLDAVGTPAVNQRFVGWQDAAGRPYVAGTPVTGDLALYARLAPWETEAALSAYERCEAAAFDTENGFSARELGLGTIALHYDQERDDYYVLAADVAPDAVYDRLLNTFAFDATPQRWRWRDAEGSAHALLLDRAAGRWYLGLSPEAGAQLRGAVQITYDEEIVHYMIYFQDMAGASLPAAYRLLAGGSLLHLIRDAHVQALLPEADRRTFDGWGLLDGLRPETIDAPLVLIAQQKPQHAVQFFLDGALAFPYAEQMVFDGDRIDWSCVKPPAKKAARFDGWALLAGGAYQDGPVKGPLTFVARFVPLHAVTVFDAAGNALSVQYLAANEPLQLHGLTAPVREGLRFSHWALENGAVAGEGMPIAGDCALHPVYQATVTFMDGATVVERRAVREGEQLQALPAGPDLGEGYVFLGWEGLRAGQAIGRDTTAHARMAVEISFYYGLSWEARRVVVVPLGGRATPPDATVDGYTYTWDPDPATMRFDAPAIVAAYYAWIPDASLEEGPDQPAQEDWLPPPEDLWALPMLPYDELLAMATPHGPAQVGEAEVLFDIPDYAVPLYGFLAGEKCDCFE